MSWDSDYWVYFKRLQIDATKPKKRPNLGDLYETGKSKVANLDANVIGNSNSGQRILDMANVELTKEQALLSQCFGVNIQFDFREEGAVQSLIEVINACLNLRSVYERSRQFIALSGGREKEDARQAFVHFDTYLNQALRDKKEDIIKAIIPLFKSGANFGEAVRQAIEPIFDTVILPDAIEKAFNVTNRDTGGTQEANAYKALIEAIRNFPSNNPLAAGIKSAWGLDTILDTMITEISNLNNKGQLQRYMNGKGLNGITSQISKKYTNHSAGLTAEALYDQIAAMIAGGLGNINIGDGQFRLKGGVKGGALSEVGRKGARPDAAVVFNANTSKVEQMIQNTSVNSRQDAINLFSKVSQYINNIDKSFIVYVNEKNYLMFNEEFGGYSAGKAMSLEAIEPELSKVVDNTQDLIEVILNAGSGAVGEGNTDNASEVIAQAIAFTLFDDWNTIGVASSGGQSIHIMNLNGVLIPLSAFLFSLGNAITTAQNNAAEFASASIHTASYDVSDSAAYDNQENSIENWYNTVNFGKSNTTISFHFMKNIQSFLGF